MRIGKLWFQSHQRELLYLARTRAGRSLLHIKEDFLEDIEVIRPSSITARLSENERVSVVSSGSRFARAVCENWREYQSFQDWYYGHEIERLCQGLPAWAIIGGGASNDVSPDAEPETDTCDGHTVRTGVDEVWATIRAGAGTAGSADDATLFRCRIRGSTTPNQLQWLGRLFLGYDTRFLGADSIQSAVHKTTVEEPLNVLGGGTNTNSRHILCSASPASPTDVVAADHAIANFGTVNFAQTGPQNNLPDETEIPITLNANGIAAIDKNGITQFGFRNGWDFNDVDPFGGSGGCTWSSNGWQGLDWHSAEGTAGKEPTLTIVHRGRHMISIMG